MLLFNDSIYKKRISLRSSSEILDEFIFCFRHSRDFIKYELSSLHSFTLAKSFFIVEQPTKKIDKIKIMKKFFFIIIIILYPFNIFATDLLVAGFALSGDYSTNEENYKYTSKLFETNNSEFNSSIRDNIKKNNYGHNFIFEYTEDVDETAILFTLARENISLDETYDGLFRARIRVLGQIMIFNNNDQVIDAIYSFPISFTKIFNTRPNGQNIKDLFYQFYFGNENFVVKDIDENGTTKCNDQISFVNFFDYMLMQIPCIDIKESYAQRIKVKEIKLSKKTLDFLDKSEKNKDAFKQEVGLTITSMLSTELKMPILPFIDEGQDIYTVKTRFSDSSIKNLKLPDSDFDIEIEIKAFNKKKIDSNDIEEQWLYAFQSKFKFYEPLSETVYFEDTLIGYEYKTFPKSYIKKTSDFQIYLEVINYFYRDLALSFDAINNIKKIQKKSALRQKDDNQNNLSSTGFNWASSSVLQDWYMTRSKLKYKDIKSMLIQTKEKINQCR